MKEKRGVGRQEKTCNIVNFSISGGSKNTLLHVLSEKERELWVLVEVAGAYDQKKKYKV